MKPFVQLFVLGSLTAVLALSTGCASFSFDKNVVHSTRVSQPPPGKALVNFHRPSKWAGSFLSPVFDGKGEFIGLLEGGSEFQWICPPGEHVFVSWSEDPGNMKRTRVQTGAVAALQADVQADKMYDVMVDLSPGWISPPVAFSPLTRSSERRDRLGEFEGREKTVTSGMQPTPEVADYRAKRQAKVEEVVQDFLRGAKHDKLRYVKPEDFRQTAP